MSTRTHLAALHQSLGRGSRIALVAVPVGVVLLFVGLAMLRSPEPELDAQGRLIQRGIVAQIEGQDEYDVIYETPYTSPPQLRWPNKPLGYEMLEQRADGFRLKITHRTAHDLPPRWEATGIPAQQQR